MEIFVIICRGKKVCLRLEVVFVFLETELMCKIFDINGFSE